MTTELAQRRAPRHERPRALSARGVLRDRATWITLALLIVTAVVLVTRPGGTMQGTSTQSVVVSGISGILEPGTTISQELEATQDGLSGISTTFGTFAGSTDCAVDVVVTEEDGDVLSDETLPCAEIADSSKTSVADFDTVEDSAGQTYTVAFALADGDWQDPVTIWVGQPDDAAVAATADGPSEGIDAVFAGGNTATTTVAEYRAPTVWDQIGVVLDQAAAGAPFWSQPPAMVLWVLLAGAAVVGAVALRRRTALLTVAVVVLALCRGMVWSTVLPPMEGMDEGAHIAYAQFVAVEHRLPVRGQAFADFPNTYSEQLGVMNEHQRRQSLLTGGRAERSDEAIADLRERLEAASPKANGSAPAAAYPPAYYLPAAAAYALTPGTLLDKVYSMRLWSVALGGLAAWATVAAAVRLFPRSRLAVAGLAIAVTVQPMMAHQFAIVNNDGLAIAAGIAAFAAALRIATGRTAWWYGALAGAAIGVALLAKPYGIGALPVVGIALLFSVARSERRWLALLRGIGTVAAGIALTYGPWLLLQRVLGLPGQALPVYTDTDPNRSLPHYIGLQLVDDWASLRERWGAQMFGKFAWLDVGFPFTVYDITWWGLRVVAVLTALWLLYLAVDAFLRRARPGAFTVVEDRGTGLVSPVRMSLSVAHVLGVFGALYAAGYLYFRSAGKDELLQGRYALLALPAILAAAPLALEGMLNRVRGRWARAVPVVVMVLIAVGMWTLQVIGIAIVADHYYL
jgi:4-amino-4-deoxy-L-arabinose transferase-like glycosyltransferase